jgi:hypothetical protein
MNLRQEAIMKWCKQFRPDLIQHITPKGNQSADDAFALLMSIGFEAGRQFQADRPTAPLNNPNLYLGMAVNG